MFTNNTVEIPLPKIPPTIIDSGITQEMKLPAISGSTEEWEPKELLNLTENDISILLENLGPDYRNTHPELWEYAKTTLKTNTEKEPTKEEIIKRIKLILEIRKNLDLENLNLPESKQ